MVLKWWMPLDLGKSSAGTIGWPKHANIYCNFSMEVAVVQMLRQFRLEWESTIAKISN